MKKIILLSAAGAVTALMAGFSEQAYLYKDARIMGMGGANVAVGGYSTSLFHNPAGLAGIKKSDGFVVELLGVTLAGSEHFKDFMDDLDDTETDADVIRVLQKYDGAPFHADVTNYSSVSKNSDLFAWSAGLLAAADMNMMPHANSGTLETQSRGYGGVFVGAAKSYEAVGPGTLDVGISLKYVLQKSYEGSLTTAEVLANKDDLERKLDLDKVKKVTGMGEVAEISLVKKRNLAKLETAIIDKVWRGEIPQPEATFVNNARHTKYLEGARNVLKKTLKKLNDEDASPEIVASLLKEALFFLGSILGDTVQPDILDRIFSRFCVGK